MSTSSPFSPFSLTSDVRCQFNFDVGPSNNVPPLPNWLSRFFPVMSTNTKFCFVEFLLVLLFFFPELRTFGGNSWGNYPVAFVPPPTRLSLDVSPNKPLCLFEILYLLPVAVEK